MDFTIKDLQPILREIFENDKLEVCLETTASDIREWDSINHIYLVVAIEQKFSVKFTTKEIQNWKSIGDILTDLNRKK